MNKKVKRNITVGVLMASIFTFSSIEQPKLAEAGWLGDAIGAVIGAATGDKAVRRNSAAEPADADPADPLSLPADPAFADQLADHRHPRLLPGAGAQ